MILSQAEQPRIQPLADRQAPQLLIDFPKARVANVPVAQAGDQQLVKQVRTAALPGGGVRIIVELMPGKPYSYWRSSRMGARGGYQYIVGIKPDSPRSETYLPVYRLQRELQEAVAPSRTYSSERESNSTAEAERPSYGESSSYSGSSEYQRPTSGEMGEIARLMPAAGPVLGFLQQQGWSVQKDSSGRGGASQKFLLASSRYPNLSIKIEHIPTRAAGSPGINLIAVSTDKLAGQRCRQIPADDSLGHGNDKISL